jgi:hypothetical protein
MSLIIRFSLLVGFLMCQFHGAIAAKSIALVIGNSAYAAPDEIKTARQDAEAIGDALTRLGFSVIQDTDSDQRSMRTFIRQFSDALAKADIALFYYSGHAVQWKARNYLLPIGARIEQEQDIELEGIALDLVLSQMQRIHGRRIVLLDASRENSVVTTILSRGLQRSKIASAGLAPISTDSETLVEFAAAPNAISMEADGDHSTFTAALLQSIRVLGPDFEAAVRRAHEDVVRATSSRQVPWSNISMDDEATPADLEEKTSVDIKPGPKASRQQTSDRVPAQSATGKKPKSVAGGHAKSQGLATTRAKPKIQKSKRQSQGRSKSGATTKASPATSGSKSGAAHLQDRSSDRAALCKRLLNGPPPNHRHRHGVGRMLMYNEFCRGRVP